MTWMLEARTLTHPASKKAILRRAIDVDRAVTTGQLERWGLLAAAEWLGLPQVLRSERVCRGQRRSMKDLTFVCRDERVAAQAPRNLMHYAGLAEFRARYDLVRPGRWRHVDERRPGFKPDAEFLSPGMEIGEDVAVEFDAGYSMPTVLEKLRAFGQEYTTVVWAVSSMGRVGNINEFVRQLPPADLGGLREVATVFVDFWTPDFSGYRQSPRNHKELIMTWRRGQPGVS